jgi:hypothetical protein
LFSSWVHRSLVLLKRGRQTSSRWRFSRKNDWIVQVIPQQAIKAIRVLSTRKMVLRRQELGWHFLLRRQVVFTAVYCGAVSSSSREFILHEMMPAAAAAAAVASGWQWLLPEQQRAPTRRAWVLNPRHSHVTCSPLGSYWISNPGAPPGPRCFSLFIYFTYTTCGFK